MKKFQQILKQKAHLAKIKNAKKTISGNVRIPSKLNTSKINDQAQLLLKLYQNKNYDSIPAYKLLRTTNLQQYTKGFIQRGYGINLAHLALLTDDDKKKLYQDLKVLPGHTVKLDKIIKAIAKEAGQNLLQATELSSLNTLEQQSRKEKTLYTHMHRNIPFQDETQYKKQLQRVLNQYTPIMTQNKTSKSSNNEKRSSILGSAQLSSKTKYVPPKNTLTSDFRKKPIVVQKFPSTQQQKRIIRKSELFQNQKQNSLKQISSKQSTKQSLKRLLQNVQQKSLIESQKVMLIDLQFNKVKERYRSFDGALMSSTIVNLDIQELVYAFAGFVQHRVVAAEQPNFKPTNSMDFNLKFGQKFQDSLDHQQPIQDQIGSILRQSYLHPLYRQSTVLEQIQGEQVESQGSCEDDEQTGNRSNQFTQNSIDNKMMQSSFLGTQSYQFGLKEPVHIFQQPQPTQIDYFKPTVDSIFNFIKNIVLAAKMQRQIPVMAASYLQSFLQKSCIQLTSTNYKRMLVICLLLASKIWDDQSFESPSFAKTFPQYSTILLNEMEKQILKFLDYKLKIDKKEYALTYFKLRRWIKRTKIMYQENQGTSGWYQEGLQDQFYHQKKFILTQFFAKFFHQCYDYIRIKQFVF